VEEVAMTAARVRRNVLTVVGAAAMGLAMVMPALADDTTSAGTTALVKPGTLDITQIVVSTFEDATITGQDQDVAATLNGYSVTDFRGTGVGWHVTAQADQFVDGSKSLDLGSLTMSKPTVTADGTSSAPPTVAAAPTFTLDAEDAVQIASAGVGQGMGKFDFTATDLTLSLPADVYAGNYASTLTFTAVTAP
jgi:hypothetical protein